MTKRNPYLQHTYESFDQPVPPKRPPQEPGFAERILGSDMLERVRSPLFATVALLLTGAAFAGIIIASYPDGDQPGDNIPVITADATPLREAPSDPGGMAVAHEDSTIYGSIRSAGLQETPPIENLLAAEKPVEAPPADALASLGTPGQLEAVKESAEESGGGTVSAVEPAAGDLQPAAPVEMAGADPLNPSSTNEAGEAQAPSQSMAEAGGIPMKADVAPAEKPAMAPAASTPETLAYVRSVLENKDASKDMASASAATEESAAPAEMPAIEPASGAAAAAGAAIKPGSTYIQLASIGSESAASKEWAKLQKAHSSLSGLEYRVQRADLGAKGVFFRIQAGPMSKDSAKSVCNAIKAQKPGGCIIVQ